MEIIMDAVSGIRSIRGELNISPSLELKALIKDLDNTEEILKENITYICKMARAKEVEISKDVQLPRNAAASIKPNMEIFVPLEGLIDIDAEISRLNKEHKKTEQNLAFVKRKLHNKEFISKAPKTVVEENKVKYNEYLDKLNAVQENIDKLKKLGE
jgi:valyl-tRNA synthetase